MLFACTFTSADKDVDKKKDELKKIEQEIEGKKTQIEDIDKEEKDILSQLDEIEKKTSFNYVESKRLQKKIMNNQENVREIERELLRIDKKQSEIKKMLKKRLRSLYKLGKRSWIEILLTSPDIIKFYRKLKLTREIAKTNSKILLEITGYKQKKIELRNKMKSKKKNLCQLKKSADIQLTKYRKEKTSKGNYVKEIVSKKNKYMDLINRLEKQAKELEALIKKLTRGKKKKKLSDSMISNLKPVLEWPVDGEIIGSFGKYKDAEIDEYKYRDGIYIKVKSEQEVVASDDGKVVYTGWFKGRGNIIIIEHKNDLTAVYGQLGQILVKKGEKVSRNEMIATTGDTGYLNQSSFYFGVWYGGNVIDPIIVLKY